MFHPGGATAATERIRIVEQEETERTERRLFLRYLRLLLFRIRPAKQESDKWQYRPAAASPPHTYVVARRSAKEFAVNARLSNLFGMSRQSDTTAAESPEVIEARLPAVDPPFTDAASVIQPELTYVPILHSYRDARAHQEKFSEMRAPFFRRTIL